MDNLDPLVDNLEIIDDEISFGTGGDVTETVIDIPVEAVALTDSDTVLDVAAPIAIGTAVPLAAAIVREEEHVDVVEERVAAPISVIEEPVYTAPVVEPVHAPRWPWALLALPLLAIPFLARGHETTPVAEPVVVQTPVVREVTPVPEVVEEVIQEKADVPTEEVVVAKPLPTCDGDFIAKDATVLRATATDTGTEVGPIAANTVLFIDAVEGDYYEVTAGNSHGYLPESVVVCQVALAPATVTG